MFDTMTITKAAGALIGALLFLLLAGWAASGIYHVGASGGHGNIAGHERKMKQIVFTIATIHLPFSASKLSCRPPPCFARSTTAS